MFNSIIWFVRAAPALALAVCAGCVQLPAHPNDAAFAPVYVPTPVPAPTTPGALYRSGQGISLFGDRRAQHLGDVITITLQENFQSKKANKTTVSKSTSASASEPTVLGSVLHKIATTAGVVVGLTSKDDFAGQAGSDQSNSLSGTVTVTVTDVQPNGLLVVQGEKWLTLNRGEEYVRLSGMVRAEDVAPDNTISSDRVANARIVYSGKGELADSNAMGWLARFFVNPLFPW
jgi:flagellar L-ring protein FlgH